MTDEIGTGRLRVIVIDDDQQTLEYLSELLSADDCDVTTISDPHQGLERLRPRHELWHILILDLEMPDMPGLRLLEKLRQFDRELAVITLTDQPSAQSTSDAIKLDVSAYMHKPFSGDEMRNTIAQVARKHGAIVRAEDRLYVLVGRKSAKCGKNGAWPSKSSAAARICRNRCSRRSSVRRRCPRSLTCSASPVRSRSRCPSSLRSTSSITSG